MSLQFPLQIYWIVSAKVMKIPSANRQPEYVYDQHQ